MRQKLPSILELRAQGIVGIWCFELVCSSSVAVFKFMAGNIATGPDIKGLPWPCREGK